MTTLTRRQMFGGISLAAVTAALPALAAVGPRPNILFALADDWSWQSALAIDELGLALPAFDRVRRSGVTFNNAFVAAPTCTTSRSSILTGRPPWQLEEAANLASILRAKFAVYPELLETVGYVVGFSGKGWAPGQLAPVGRTRNPAGDAYKDFGEFLGKRKAGAPFCFWLGSADPHRPFAKGQGRAAGVSMKGKLPPYLADSAAVRDDIADYMWAAQRFDSQVGAALKALEAAGELDNTLVVVTGDNGWAFPRGKATLYDAGTHVPLAAMWPARIKPGQTTEALVSLTDLPATFLDAAGVPKPAAMTSVSLLPLMTTGKAPHTAVITAMERHMDGRTQGGWGYPMRALRTQRYLYIRNFKPDRWPAGDPPRKPVDTAALETRVFAAYADIDQGPAKAWMAQHPDDPASKAALGKRPAQELYDVKADPYEMHNLAGDPARAALLKSLDAQLMAELRRLADPRLGANPDVFDQYPAYNDPGFERPADF